MRGVPSGPLTLVGFRHVVAGFTSEQALSGEGARKESGRFNLRGEPAVYLAFNKATAIAEWVRLAGKYEVSPSDMPRDLLRCELRVARAIDLRGAKDLEAVGIDPDGLVSCQPGRDEYALVFAACQQVGRATRQAGFEALLAPSATGAGDIAVVFPDLLQRGSVLKEVARTRRWDPWGPGAVS